MDFINQFFGGAWSLVTGQSVGREGPAVHLGAASGSLLGQWLRLPNNSLRPLAGCGVAAAIAACFNTPMAGVIFAMEVVVMEYSIAGFIPVILAAVAGSTINQLVFGSSTVFHPPQAALQSLLELPFMVITGVIVAVFAALFINLQAICCKLSLNRPIALRFAIAGLLAGCVSIFAPEIMGVGYDTIDSALTGNMGFWFLIGILAAKLVVTGVSLGVGIPGGVIGPLLFMGACIGGAVGIIANQLMPGSASHIGFYALLGMGAMMGATLNAPLAAMMAIMELTYNPNIIFPGMLVIVSACLTTRWVFRCEGLFQTLLTAQGKKNSLAATEQLLSRTGIRVLLDKHIK
ncbi:MAG: chloride channel protein, partial [Moraxellaceae bacterium]